MSKKNKLLTIGVSALAESYDSVVNKLEKINSAYSKLIVVQGGNVEIKNKEITTIVDSELGLSRSRNLLLKQCKTKYLLISDDDQEFEEKGIEKLVLFLEDNPECDVVTGRIKTPQNKMFKSYKKTFFEHNFRTILSVASIEMMLRVQSVHSAGVKFDERFGLGTENKIAEETIFLNDMRKNGAILFYVPVTVAIHAKISSGEKITKQLVIGRGASFYRIYGFKSIFLLPAYVAKQRRNYKRTKINFVQFFIWCLSGFVKEMFH